MLLRNFMRSMVRKTKSDERGSLELIYGWLEATKVRDLRV